MSVKFSLGEIVSTQGVHKQMQEDAAFESFVLASIVRHSQCDFGDMCQEDKDTNMEGLQCGGRIFSAYTYTNIETNIITNIWVITEADRSVTTVLFPDEY